MMDFNLQLFGRIKTTLGETSMSHIATSNVTCAISAEESWNKLSDISLAHNYVPNINSTKITTQQKTGVGASRRVSGQQSLDETVTEWKEGKGFTIKLHNGDKPVFPFNHAEFTYRIDKLDDKSCKLTTTMIYEVRWGFIGKILNSLLFWWHSPAQCKGRGAVHEKVLRNQRACDA